MAARGRRGPAAGHLRGVPVGRGDAVTPSGSRERLQVALNFALARVRVRDERQNVIRQENNAVMLLLWPAGTHVHASVPPQPNPSR